MKVIYKRAFDDLALRTIRAAVGRSGKASRKECLTFIDRAIADAIKRAPDPKPVRRKRVKPGPTFVTVSPETPEEVAAAVTKIGKLYRR